MIEENGIITAKKTLYERISSVLKDNAAQLAIIVPILTTIQVSLLNYYFYLENCGYYNYFGIDEKLMLPNDKISIYHNIGIITLLVAYWIYSILAVRMFLLKGNYLWKIVCSIIIPFFVNGMLAYKYVELSSLVLVAVFYIPFHWAIIFSLGFCWVMTFHADIISNFSKPKKNKSNKKKRARWGNKEYGLLGILLIVVACIILFYQGYFENYMRAENQKRFGIVNVEGGQYVVIDSNTHNLILQRCQEDADALYIDKNTYFCIENNTPIQYKTFKDVLFQ